MMLARATGLVTTEGNGEPFTPFSAPLLSMENTEMVLESRLATNRKLPPVSVVTDDGPVPAATGEPLNGVSAPELLMEKAETLFEP